LFAREWHPFAGGMLSPFCVWIAFVDKAPLTAEGLPATWFRHEHRPWVFFPAANRSALPEDSGCINYL